MNIINSDIIESKHDVFWENVPALAVGAVPAPVLVLVSGCIAGSAEEAQLQKMLEACKLKPEQYNITRLEGAEQIAWLQLREKLGPKIIFLIGIMPAQLGISALFRLNEANNFGGRIWLPTLSLSELEKHKDAKTQLWQNGMKPVFIDSLI